MGDVVVAGMDGDVDPDVFARHVCQLNNVFPSDAILLRLAGLGRIAFVPVEAVVAVGVLRQVVGCARPGHRADGAEWLQGGEKVVGEDLLAVSGVAGADEAQIGDAAPDFALWRAAAVVKADVEQLFPFWQQNVGAGGVAGGVVLLVLHAKHAVHGADGCLSAKAEAVAAAESADVFVAVLAVGALVLLVVVPPRPPRPHVEDEGLSIAQRPAVFILRGGVAGARTFGTTAVSYFFPPVQRLGRIDKGAAASPCKTEIDADGQGLVGGRRGGDGDRNGRCCFRYRRWRGCDWLRLIPLTGDQPYDNQCQ